MINILLIIGIVSVVIGIKLMMYLKYKKLASLDLDNPTDYRKAAEICFGPIQELYQNATLIISPIQNKDITSIYDFSLWKEKKIIGVYINSNKNKPSLAFKQTVARFKDGSVIWLPQQYFG